MTKFALLALALFAGAAAARSAAQPNPPSEPCMPSDALSDLFVRSFRAGMVAGDAGRLALQLPLVDPNAVQVVQADSICIRAQEALDDYIITVNPAASGLGPRRLYVIAIDDYHAVHDPGEVAGEYTMVNIFSPTWAMLTAAAF